MNTTNRIPRRPRILFVAEAATLAHVARPAVLAQSLDADEYEVAFASDPRFDGLFPEMRARRIRIHSIPSADFLKALAAGKPLYDAATLRSYVKEDLAVMEEFQPDLVVGDFRISLSISARLARVPYMAITNAYWSPFAKVRFPVPELPLTRYLGYTLSGLLFRIARPVAFALHTRPLNRVRGEKDLPTLGFDLRRTYTDADWTLYADVPELLPTLNRPENHVYLGPILWAPSVPFPSWWSQLPEARPKVYVTLGSSGQVDLLPRILAGLANLPVVVMAATAGRIQVSDVPPNALVADYLPGMQAAARASVVVCNGGSPTTHQALAAGTPVLGIVSNLDQCLNMDALDRVGAGRVLRPGHANARAIRQAVQQILEQPRFAESARGLRAAFARYPAAQNFRKVVEQALGRETQRRRDL